MSLEARIAKVVAASAAAGAAPAWGAGGASSDAEWESCDDAELRPSGGGEEEEEEEVVEMDEAEVMALLDAEEAALFVCQRLFLPPPPAGTLQLLPAAAVERLRRDGWAVVPAFLGVAEAAAARTEALDLYHGGAFAAAAAAAPADETARGDAVMWLRASMPPASPGLAAALARLAALQQELARVLQLHADVAPELQLAVYAPGGAAYARHRDAFPEAAAPPGCGPGQRRVTAVLYANDAVWDCGAAGGALRLHVPPPPPEEEGGGGDEEQARGGACVPGATHVDVAPRGGTLVLFLSGAVDHEVLPSTHEHRVALTSWMR